jgi:large subunit ribosomal protein L24
VKSVKTRVKLPVKRGDVVVAISGEDAAAGKTGKILQIFPETQRALVEGFNYVKKHLRKSQDNTKGGIVEKEASVHISNLKLHTESEEKVAAGKAKKV